MGVREKRRERQIDKIRETERKCAREVAVERIIDIERIKESGRGNNRERDRE